MDRGCGVRDIQTQPISSPPAPSNLSGSAFQKEILVGFHGEVATPSYVGYGCKSHENQCKKQVCPQARRTSSAKLSTWACHRASIYGRATGHLV